MASMLSCFHTLNVKLDGKNYKEWEATVSQLLDGLCLWGHIDDSTPKPIPPFSISDGSTVTTAFTTDYEHKLEKWITDEAKAKMTRV